MSRTSRRAEATVLSALLLLASFAMGQVAVRRGLTLDQIPAHDPFILADGPTHRYFLYTSEGRIAADHRSEVVAYTSQDLQEWSGPDTVFEVPDGSWADPTGGVWAPEVHAYRGRYYLFATLNNYSKPVPVEGEARDLNRGMHIGITFNGVGPHLRGTQVFVSDSPAGPFKTILDRPIPPFNYMTLDGTFYVEEGAPYMVYSHEWTQLVDGNMEAIPMKPDLSEAAGRPMFLFKGSDAPWLDDPRETVNSPQNYVTDGPEMYRTRTGTLLMLWSSFRRGRYVEIVAHSTSGKLRGPWKQDDVLLGGDSGHGMLFQTFDGRLMLVLHHPFDSRVSRARIFPVEDTGSGLRIQK